MIDEATVLGALRDDKWRSVSTLRTLIGPKAGGVMPELTEMLRRMARDGKIELVKQATKAPRDRRGPGNAKGPVLTLDLYRRCGA